MAESHEFILHVNHVDATLVILQKEGVSLKVMRCDFFSDSVK